MNRFIVSACIAAGGLVAACASSVPPPTDQWSAAQLDIGRAQATDAKRVPEAKLHLQLAEENLMKGRELMGKDNRHARTVIELARAEAVLASTLAQAADARTDSQRANDAYPKGGDQ